MAARTARPATGEPSATPATDGAPMREPRTIVPAPRAESSVDDAPILAVVHESEELGAIFTRRGDTPDTPRLPLRAIAQLAGLSVQVDGDALVVQGATLPPFEARVMLRTGIGARRRGDGAAERIALAAGTLLRDGDEYYLAPDAFTALTGLPVVVDRGGATLALAVARDRLPRFAAESRRRLRGGDRQGDPDATPTRITGDAVRAGALPQGIALTYAHTQDNQRGDHATLATIGTTLLGGGLAVDLAQSRAGSERRRSARWSWLGGDPTSRWLRQLRLGSGTSTGIAALPGRGVSLTNAPFLRPMQLGTVTQGGTAPPGAEIEIARGGRLVGVAVADSSGRWSFPVPVAFGQNALELTIYTKDGVQRRTTLVAMEPDLIPSRRVEYGVTVQRTDEPERDCTRALLPCGVVGNADLRAGLTSRLTARAGVYTLRADDRGASQVAPYATLVGSPTDWVQLRGETGGRDWWRARAVLQPSLAFRAEAGREAASRTQAPFWLPARALGVTDETNAALTVRPIASDLGRLWLNASWRQLEGVRGRASSLGLTAGGRVRSLLLQATGDVLATRATLGPAQRTVLAGASLTVPQLGIGPWWLRRSFVSLSAGTLGTARLDQGALTLTTTLPGALVVQGGVDWRRGASPLLRLQLQHQGPFALLFQNVATSGGRTTASTTLTGSVVQQRFGVAPQASSDVVALRARVSGLVFEDRDGDGQFGPTEPRLADVAVLVGSQRVVTDATGSFLARGLPVLDALPVTPDAPVLFNEGGEPLVAALPVQWALLVPYGETRLSLPFVAGGAVRVRIPAGAWRATLVSVDHPDEPARSVEQFDEARLTIGPLRPGRWRLLLAREDGRVATGCTFALTRGTNAPLALDAAQVDAARPCAVEGAP